MRGRGGDTAADDRGRRQRARERASSRRPRLSGCRRAVRRGVGAVQVDAVLVAERDVRERAVIVRAVAALQLQLRLVARLVERTVVARKASRDRLGHVGHAEEQRLLHRVLRARRAAPVELDRRVVSASRERRGRDVRRVAFAEPRARVVQVRASALSTSRVAWSATFKSPLTASPHTSLLYGSEGDAAAARSSKPTTSTDDAVAFDDNVWLWLWLWLCKELDKWLWL